MSCYKHKNHIVLKNGDIWSVWRDDIKFEEFMTEKAALKFIDKNII